MGVNGRSRGRGETKHIASLSAEDTATSCVTEPLRVGASVGDPELKVFGSQEEKRETDAEKGTNGVRLLRLGDYCCLGKKLHFINSFQ